jgi:hypothetical protein
VAYGGVKHEGGLHDRLLKLTQRLDGFVSLDAGDEKGEVITKPLVFEGDQLQLNIAASGAARVALLDQTGKPFEGFSLDDCVPIRADDVRKTVSWKNGAEVGELAGKPVRVNFELRDAKLYAMQFVHL